MTYRSSNDGKAYAFVTREEIEKEINQLDPDRKFLSLLLNGKWLDRLFAERDAIREAYIRRLGGLYGAPGPERIDLENEVDAEAVRILEI